MSQAAISVGNYLHAAAAAAITLNNIKYNRSQNGILGVKAHLNMPNE